MRKNTIWKSAFREIRQSFGRFVAILAIVALGVAFFAGLKVARSAMVKTTETYLEEMQFFDYRLVSTLGFENEDVSFFAEKEEVRAAEGSVTWDILYQLQEGTGGVLRAHTLTSQVNQVKVLAGRLPKEPWECVVDANLFGEDSLGETITLSQDNETEDLDSFAYGEYTIVGIVQSPYYIQYERGNTSLGSGLVSGFMYLLPEGFALDYYTEIFIKFDKDFELYSDAYDSYMDEKEVLWEEFADEAALRRYDEIRAEGEAEIADAREELAQEKADAEAELADAEAELIDAETELTDGEAELADAKAELRDGEATLAEKEAELADAKKEVEDGEAQLAEGEAELADAIDEWNDQSKELNDSSAQVEQSLEELSQQEDQLAGQEALLVQGETALSESQAALDAQRQETENSFLAAQTQLEEQEAELEAAYGAGMISEEEYDTSKAALEEGKQELEAQREAALGELASAQDTLDASAQELAQNRAALEEGRETLASYRAQLSDASAQLDYGHRMLADGWMEIQDAQAQLERSREELESAKTEIADGEIEIADAKQEIADGWQEIADAEEELLEGRQEYEDGLAEYQDARAEFEQEIADAEAEIADAEAELNDLELPETYVLGRDTNVGYVCFENDSSIVDGIANIFPVFFFLVAALVCSTTMNRMVEEQRTQIGVLKALGYGKGVIMLKYLFYSGTGAILGSVIGFVGGSILFPKVIWTAYGMMYRVDSLIVVFDPVLAVISLTAAILCTMGATWLTCRYELSQVAAELMRPKAPRAGKRVFLEYVPFIWRRLGFLKKVSVRNIFRYKKRLLMMVAGISGCTALLVTGFGVKDSVANIATQQFEEIQIYDIGVTLSETVTDQMEEALTEALGEELSGYYALMESSMDLVTNQGTKSVNLVVAQESEGEENIASYLNLHTQRREPLPYPEKGETVITRKAADQLGISVGDTVTLQDEDGNTITLRVSGLSRNFIYNYVYMNKADYEEQMGEEAQYKTIWVNVSENADVHRASASLMQLEGVSNVTVNADTMERFGSMMESLNMIVVVIIICAGGLAFIVLYNLTNINITERIREIATIKVLGFYKNETASYVFRENTVLALMGTLVGLPLGMLLHRFVMSQVQIDMVAFDVQVLPVSYLYSAVLTMLFAWLINRFMRRKLDRVSMTESLKSVD